MTVKMGQIGTGHGHAAGKARSMRTNPEVELVGVFEPNPERAASARGSAQWADIPFVGSIDEILGDPEVSAVAIEGSNDESLSQARIALAAGKHLWYDKPAGDDLRAFQELVEEARRGGRYLQMGYMFRYHHGFRQLADWTKSGLLGEVFSVRAHMSTWIPTTSATNPQLGREGISPHSGGIFYDLGGHMLDQIVWLLGRPRRAQGFFQNAATPEVPAFSDNTLGVFEFDRALAFVDIAAMERPPMARRFEVYGTKGSAILEPFEPAPTLRLTLDAARGGFAAGLQTVPLAEQPRQTQYERELVAFLGVIRGERAPDRGYDHELLVQETLLRATGAISS